MEFDEVLLIHLGGLGDVCLSESLFLSLSLEFQNKLVALGVKRYLSLFSQYFVRVENIESLRWLFLFSQEERDLAWKRIVFIGKDREGRLREKWERYSKDPLIFVDMYPQREKIHVEEYQLRQIETYGLRAKKKKIEPNVKPLVILYPERWSEKKSWKIENFLELEKKLKEKGVKTIRLGQIEAKTDDPDALYIEDLQELKKFFESNGGVFVSNDSGIAHLAGVCGLATFTIFSASDPDIWHPRGKNISFSLKAERLSSEMLEKAILDVISTFCLNH
ncbi:MAG: hypothetical protein NZ583_05085 [Desulfobacterota bacterium]|nr:hypothetical protein [Thermodesulfobacteriota bacterium]